MNTLNLKVLQDKLESLTSAGKTSLDVFGINGDLLSQVEKENPYVAKQGLWHTEQKEAC